MENIREINFDMDGTFVNLYGVDNWLNMIRNADATPYLVASPLLNLAIFARTLNRLQRKGYTINIISWLAKTGSDDFHKRVTEAKLTWLAKHLPSVKWNNINIVSYGTPKSTYGNGILFDDEEPNRKEWNGVAYDVNNILEVLKNLLTNM